MVLIAAIGQFKDLGLLILYSATSDFQGKIHVVSEKCNCSIDDAVDVSIKQIVSNFQSSQLIHHYTIAISNLYL